MTAASIGRRAQRGRARLDRAGGAAQCMATAPEMPRREEMRRGAHVAARDHLRACALPAAIGVALLEGGSAAAVWLIALAVAAMGALMIAQRFIYWQFAGLGHGDAGGDRAHRNRRGGLG
jgi:hypothetical protein